MMQLSQQGIELIARFEGLSLQLYTDPTGNASIGIGHLVHLGPINGSEPQAFKDGITTQQAYDLLKSDAQKAADCIAAHVQAPLTQNRIDALISFVYNVGCGAFMSSDLLTMLNQGNYAVVPGQLMRWVHGTINGVPGVVLPGLVTRRTAEGVLFASQPGGIMKWFEYEICVPFGNPQYDVGLGGPHDMDVRTPPNTPITALLAGTVVDIGEPTWGMVIGVKLDQPYKGIPYMAYLHLAAVNVKLNDHIVPGQLIAWSGGCTAVAQYGGTSNPTNRNFINTPNMSSQPQTGIAIMRGPVYGSGLGWENFPSVDWSLDPTQIILDARIHGGQDMPVTIDINTPIISEYYAPVNGNQWQRKNAPGSKVIILHGDMLIYYMTCGTKPYCGLSQGGLILSNEIPIEQFGPEFAHLKGSGIVIVYLERQVWIYDPNNLIDNPPGAGTVYPLHLYQLPGQDPLVTKLQAQVIAQQATITAQEAQIAQLQTQQTSEPDPIAAIHAVQAAVAPFK